MTSFRSNRIALALVAGTALIGAAFASKPPDPSPDQGNGAGIILSEATAESWNGAVQANPAGAILTADGSADAGEDTMNPGIVAAFPGRIDPNFRGKNAAGIVWTVEPGLAN